MSEASHRVMEWCVVRTQPIVAGFEDGGRRPQAEKCGWPLDAGKGKETDSSQEDSEKNGAPLTP